MYVQEGIEVHTYTQNYKKGVFLLWVDSIGIWVFLRKKKITIRKVNDRLPGYFMTITVIKNKSPLT